jgi:hypothetical protein
VIRTRGKNIGEHLTLHQFCNDWISADDDAGNPIIVNPTSVKLEDGEAQMFINDPDPGMFWDAYQIDGDRFVRRQRRSR